MTHKLQRKLKAARLKLGLSIRDVERLSKNKVHNSHVTHLEKGRIEFPNPNLLRILCRILKLDYVSVLMLAGYLTKKDLAQ